ncbi:metallophosphoesterase [Gordonia desulfuricans]|uniref:Metallophosphoesterase n=1 Tax=Gordonia desulfuricans TaxID=89051 RepID=A0A7K3LK00_9ACTN|nr:metallophosphoesterase [Gordonia desulfuricans]NDK88589.1 metallophosphoesterase [Gordonia desulfuricans]
MFVVAHISDLHFNGTRFNRARIESALNYVNARADGINALLITGDIADEGSPSEYREAHRVIDSPLPTLITVGNHDTREGFREFVLGEPGSAPVNSARLIDGVLFLVVDSSIPGRNDGFIDDDTLTWMSAQITAAGPDTRVLVAFHHPPVVIQMTFMDTIRQTGEERLAELVDRHPNIVGFLCGHAHSACVTRFAGRPLCVAPGVASTLNLPFEGQDIVNRGQPPGVAFHMLDGDRLITHFRSVMF